MLKLALGALQSYLNLPAELGFMFAIKANRTVSIKQDEWLQVQKIDHVPKKELKVWLKDFGFVSLCHHHFKDEVSIM